MQELNNFLTFVLSKPELASATGTDKFFDVNIPETRVGEIIAKYTLKDCVRTAERLEDLYPQHRGVS